MSDEYVIEVDDTQVIAVEAAAAQGPPGTPGSNGSSSWNTLADKPSSFPSDWSTTANKPETFPPSSHSHSELEISIAETAWLSTTGNNGTAQLGNPAKKYQTVAAAIAAGAKQLEIGPGTFDFDGTELTAYVRGVSPSQSTLRLIKTGSIGDTGGPGLDAEEFSGLDGGQGGTGGQGETLTLDLNVRSDRSVTIQIAYEGGPGGLGGPGGQGDSPPGNQGPTGDTGVQGFIDGSIVLSGCVVGSLSANVANSVTVSIEDCNVTTDQPELITSFANSLINGSNPEIEATVTAANNAYLRTAFGGTVTGRVVSSGPNGKIGVPILSTAQRAAQASPANGDLFIDQASNRSIMRIAGVDRFTLAAEPISEYLTIRDYIRCVREVNTVLSAAQFSTAITSGTGSVSASAFGRRILSGSTANSTSRTCWNGGLDNSGIAIHGLNNVDSRAIPFQRPVLFSIRLQSMLWNNQNTQAVVPTVFGNGTFFRAYLGGVNTGSNYTLNRRGIGFHINDQGLMFLVAHDGTSLTTSSSLGSYFHSVGGAYTYEIALYSDGNGNVTAWRGGGDSIGSISGGPTSATSTSESPVSFECGNGTNALAVTFSIERFAIGVF